MPETDKEKLISLIRERAWMLNDIKVFTWARHNYLSELKRKGIGGGNFLMVNGAFSVLNFLSKAHSYLINGKKKGSELDMFCSFAFELEYPLFPNSKALPEADQKNSHSRIWKTFRGPLSHMAWPKGPVVAFLFPAEHSYDEVEAGLSADNTPIFFGISGNFGVYVDLIGRDMKVWVDWLCSQIDLGVFPDENVTKAVHWIENY